MLGALEGLVSTHNVFAGLHPDLARYDGLRVDPAERHKALAAHDELAIAIAALAEQVQLIAARVPADLSDLHRVAGGEGEAADRAIVITQESFANLVTEIVTRAVAEAGQESFAKKIGGDVRSALVGAGVGGATAALGPEVAATYPELITALQPYINAVLSALHGKDYPVTQAANWVAGVMRPLKPKDPDEL